MCEARASKRVSPKSRGGRVALRAESLGFFALFWLLFWASKKVTRLYKENKAKIDSNANP